MYFLISILWVIRTSKHILFWIYLWQLKDYHIGRFLDHFRTHKGRKLLLNVLLLVKLTLLLVYLLGAINLFILLLFLIYLFEALVFCKAIATSSAKKPVLTAKTLLFIMLFFAAIIILPDYLSSLLGEQAKFGFYLLLFDILTPAIVSAVILLFQPFAVLIRNQILAKAAKKMDELLKEGNLTVIGITGSYGKTTTKEFLATILSEKFGDKVLKTKEHQNSEIGIAKCILNDLTKEHKFFVVEMGAYKKGGIKLLCNMAHPKLGIVTGVNEQHMALFGSLDNLLSAEGGRELADALPKDGLLILNGDNKYCLDLFRKLNNAVKTKIYSAKKDGINSDIFATDIDVEKNSVSFVTQTKSREIQGFKANVLGRQNVQNLLAAILAAKEIGMDFHEISNAVNKIRPEQAGIVLKTGKYGLDIIDSSYSANPDGVMADLDYLSIFLKKKIVVMPCLIELGKKSSETHFKIGRKIAEVCDLAIITTRDYFDDIKTGALQAGMDSGKIVYLPSVNDIELKITTSCGQGDAVLFEGRAPGELISRLTV